jgi:hypothetical protein
MAQEVADHHHKAAEHHEHAGRHHKEAAKHQEAGKTPSRMAGLFAQFSNSDTWQNQAFQIDLAQFL